MLFEPNHRGHHSGYIEHLVEYRCEREWNDELYVVVTPKFVESHPRIINLEAARGRADVHCITLKLEEVAALKQAAASPVHPTFEEFLEGKIPPDSHAGLEWNLICQYATRLAVTHCMIMFLDRCVLPIAAGLAAPCPFSGIYLSPPYLDAHALPQPGRIRQKWLFARLLAHPQLRTLFYLDSYAIEQFGSSSPKLVNLPTLVRPHCVSASQAQALRARLAIEPNRRVLLLFGEMSEHKGLFQVLEAMALLRDEVTERICLIFAGKTRPAVQAQLAARISTLRHSCPVQIIERYGFVPEQEVQTYFEIADVVLTPYQRHVGTSGVLALAAAAQKPVLSADYGYMGRAVREYGLGLAVDTMIPNEIAIGLEHLLSEDRNDLFNRDGMRRFADGNSAERFPRLIFEHVMP